jgi:hypothetical protein
MEASVTNFKLILLSNNDIHQSYGRLYYPEYNAQNYARPKLAYEKKEAFANITTYCVQVRYSSDINERYSPTGTGAFLRFTFFTNPLFTVQENRKNNDYSYGNNYMQVQFGLTKNLKDLFDFFGVKS